MGITINGQRFDLRFEENVQCVPDLIRKLAAEALQDPAPSGDRFPQATNPAPFALTPQVA